MTEKMTVRLAIIKNFDIVGLEDSRFEDKYMFSVECISHKGEFFKIDNHVILIFLLFFLHRSLILFFMIKQ